MDFMLYPTFIISSDLGIIPCVNLPQNYRELVKKFYIQDRKENLEDYTKELEQISRLELKLQWNDEKGLTNISIGVHGGLDLDESGWPNFQAHNLGGTNSLIAACIATKYISELLKS